MASSEPRDAVLATILVVSFVAVSFPTISKQLPFIRIPAIVFFIGKHFGTGVILATAFVHLLDDAFRSLQSDKVAVHYGNIGKFTGLIIVASLLAIFLVEYVSTSYVDHLQDKSSAPPSPVESPIPSRPSTPLRSPPAILIAPASAPEAGWETALTARVLPIASETTPLLSLQRTQEESFQPHQSSQDHQPLSSSSSSPSSSLGIVAPYPRVSGGVPSVIPAAATTTTATTHTTTTRPGPSTTTTRTTHRRLYNPTTPNHVHHHFHHHHHHHHEHQLHLHQHHHLIAPIIPAAAVAGVPIEVLTNSPRIFRTAGLTHDHHYHTVPHIAHGHHGQRWHGHASEHAQRQGRGGLVEGPGDRPDASSALFKVDDPHHPSSTSATTTTTGDGNGMRQLNHTDTDDAAAPQFDQHHLNRQESQHAYQIQEQQWHMGGYYHHPQSQSQSQSPAQYDHHDHDVHGAGYHYQPPTTRLGSSSRSDSPHDQRHHHHHYEDDGGTSSGGGGHDQRDAETYPAIGRRRQVVGILVLQLGIMIHSLVIGLTLSVTSGSDFTSLTTAIIFHQLFEGLSLGIRIAALPPASSSSKRKRMLMAGGFAHEEEEEDAEEADGHERDEEEAGGSAGRSTSPATTHTSTITATPVPKNKSPGAGTPTEHVGDNHNHDHEVVDERTGFLFRPRPRPRPTSEADQQYEARAPDAVFRRVADSFLAVVFPERQRRRRTSRSKKRVTGSSGGSGWKRWWWRVRNSNVSWLKPTLSVLFAVTTPFGMGLGMVLWPRRASLVSSLFSSYSSFSSSSFSAHHYYPSPSPSPSHTPLPFSVFSHPQPPSHGGDGEAEAQMLLVQGVMSAISAGLLIYAATVEMIAGDFVFGDVEGGHHHHGHGHGGEGALGMVSDGQRYDSGQEAGMRRSTPAPAGSGSGSREEAGVERRRSRKSTKKGSRHRHHGKSHSYSHSHSHSFSSTTSSPDSTSSDSASGSGSGSSSSTPAPQAPPTHTLHESPQQQHPILRPQDLELRAEESVPFSVSGHEAEELREAVRDVESGYPGAGRDEDEGREEEGKRKSRSASSGGLQRSHGHGHGHGRESAHHHHHGSSVGKKVLAVASMFAGVLGMVLIGLGE